jgi:hypothetical protein
MYKVRVVNDGWTISELVITLQYFRFDWQKRRNPSRKRKYRSKNKWFIGLTLGGFERSANQRLLTHVCSRTLNQQVADMLWKQDWRQHNSWIVEHEVRGSLGPFAQLLDDVGDVALTLTIQRPRSKAYCTRCLIEYRVGGDEPIRNVSDVVNNLLVMKNT